MGRFASGPFWSGFFLSLFFVAFGQPAWIAGMGIFAAAFGYALFWMSMFLLQEGRHRFWLAVIWYGCVQGIQLSWMTSTHYMGPLIFAVYVMLLVGLGIQFGFLSSFLRPKKALSFMETLGFAGFWILLEWSRIYFLSGFTWNPAGLALADNRYSLQIASVFGVYGLSFWVIWTNLAGLKAWMSRSRLAIAIWALIALIPYGFGWVYQAVVRSHFQEGGQMTALLLETGLRVEQKSRDGQNPEAFIPALVQWERIWEYLKEAEPTGLIVLPEAAFPYGAYTPFCRFESLQWRWSQHFEASANPSFPPLEFPYAIPIEREDGAVWMVTNAFLAQTLANEFHADVIVGLDTEEGGRRYNAAFLFHPEGSVPETYAKRVLAPIGEYIPLQQIAWFKEFLKRHFGIGESFDVGKEAKVFAAQVPLGVAICLEEIYSALVREMRQGGARLLVSLSNDVWFPDSRLARQHFDHGRIRAVENGVFLLRSSNMGITGGVDCFGQPFGPLFEGKMSLSANSASASPRVEGVRVSVPLVSYATLYSFWGDKAILGFGTFSFFIARVWKWRWKKRLP
ncbi:MAG: apolipoprotein N-acyltransferase [Chlamydiia bacterium]|nr:apolipoprotein N-acyltransferase [Chlamydiia bacterium]